MIKFNSNKNPRTLQKKKKHNKKISMKQKEINERKNESFREEQEVLRWPEISPGATQLG